MSFISIPMDAARVVNGLSRIGYTPSSAICDIVDNAVSAKAKNIYIRIEREKDAPDTRQNNVKEYLIIDDGEGMDEDGILKALTLGSPSDEYEPKSLSKFGLGLKSASFSQGEVLELISSKDGYNFSKFVVSLPEIQRRDTYGAEEAVLTDEDHILINKYLSGVSGSIIRITQIRKNNHPSIKSTLEELRMKIGAIYFYMMSKQNLKIEVNNVECQPFDVLFTNEADQHGNLDEHEWDGLSTCWIQHPDTMKIDTYSDVDAIIEVTQLPHPPSFDVDTPGSAKKIRDKYNIGAGNYGFYVYRNERLLSWAETFGIIPRDQDFYSFRGRILIDDSADEAFNIDVKKSQIHLSDEAQKMLDDLSYEYKRKSKQAWNHAKAVINRRAGQNTLVHSNALAQQVDMPEELPGVSETESDYAEAERRELEILETQKRKVLEMVAQSEEIDQPSLQNDEAIEHILQEQVKAVIAGPEAEEGDRIFLVNFTTDNVLWEPYYDATKGSCVRINRLHRFTRLVYENNKNNTALITVINLFLLQLAGSEKFVQKNSRYDIAEVENVLEHFRRVTTEFLANMCRELGESLPSD
ncbi:ATP-binding protein [Herpetosiphon giganteus]|uniref:ATP-binding protein n=1 Tax=Herpetosiphon giganteus TaxID=2029754 RepID=UPI001956EA3E|nr:ATP-binding protein [Herpetosiphon giganteus]MBM7842187.1 hypothetical protein [Herpetosiphon giganteus]